MAVNPHAETYQGSTRFSGPVKAGTRWQDWYTYDHTDLTGLSVGDFPNAGYVVCSQSAAVEQTADGGVMKSAPIILPAGSISVSMQLIATVAWSGGDKTIQIVVRQDAGTNQSLTPATAIAAVGVYSLLPDSLQRTSRWKNINYDAGISDNISVDVGYLGVNSGTGRGILTINYVPGLNL
jgi:hypothetical protein